jgi:four helix bundle protein
VFIEVSERVDFLHEFKKCFYMFDFQKMEVYKKSKTFYTDCKLVLSGKNVERYVVDQLNRAAFSVILNIAEGSGKFSKPDRKNYFITARASVFECVATIDVLCDENQIQQAQFDQLMSQADELSKMLFAMIKNLDSK